MDYIKFKKIMFINNAIEKGWTIKKENNAYIFTKKHENRQEIFQEDYLEKFLLTNSSSNALLCKQI